ncbi:MAG: ParB/RepB/Spo0J family partition protein [Thermodesulfobacteriota bacterium]
MSKKRALGRGLEALIGDVSAGAVEEIGPLEVRVEAIDLNPLQPRKNIKDKELQALTDSVRDHGLLSPLVVRRSGPDRYELIAGERRLRAAKAAGLTRVPVVVREADRAEMLELALIENLHREDLNPIEQAESYRRLSEEFGKSQEEIARLTGQDRSTVANLIRLLGLPEAVQEDVRQGRLSAGHARALLALSEQDRILAAREVVLGRGFSVRQTEALVRRSVRSPAGQSANRTDQAYFQALAEAMTRSLGAKVRLIPRGRKGRMVIAYSSPEELERLLRILGVGPV